MDSDQQIPKRIRVKINRVFCPHCKNDNVLLIVDFSKKWDGVDNIGICIKKAYKTSWGFLKIKGCGQKFNLQVLPRKEKLFPPL